MTSDRHSGRPEDQGGTHPPAVDAAARLAAKMLATGEAEGLEAAMRQAARTMSHRGGEWHHPPASLVRRHAEAMRQQAFGEDILDSRLQSVRECIESVMAFLQEHVTDDPVLLTGAVVREHLEGDPVVWIRHYTTRAIGELAAAIEFASEEVGVSVEIEHLALRTRHGMADSITWREPHSDGDILIRLVRCAPAWWKDRETNLFRPEAVASMTLAELREAIETP